MFNASRKRIVNEGKKATERLRLRTSLDQADCKHDTRLTQFLIDGAFRNPLAWSAGLSKEISEILGLILSDIHVISALLRSHFLLEVLEYVIVPPLRFTEARMTKTTVFQEIETLARWVELLRQIRTHHRHRLEFEFLCES